jgi:hypothetical protein
VTSGTDKALASLREQWGERWEVWYVPHAMDGSVTWCARRHGDQLLNVIHAYRPEHLAEYMAEAEAGLPQSLGDDHL